MHLAQHEQHAHACQHACMQQGMHAWPCTTHALLHAHLYRSGGCLGESQPKSQREKCNLNTSNTQRGGTHTERRRDRRKRRRQRVGLERNRLETPGCNHLSLPPPLPSWPSAAPTGPVTQRKAAPAAWAVGQGRRRQCQPQRDRWRLQGWRCPQPCRGQRAHHWC